MRMRLERAGLWPPEHPDVPKHSGRQWYFRHTQHKKAAEVSATAECGVQIHLHKLIVGYVEDRGWGHLGITSDY